MKWDPAGRRSGSGRPISPCLTTLIIWETIAWVPTLHQELPTGTATQGQTKRGPSRPAHSSQQWSRCNTEGLVCLTSYWYSMEHICNLGTFLRKGIILVKWLPWMTSTSEGFVTEDRIPAFFVPVLTQLNLHPSLIPACHLALVHSEQFSPRQWAWTFLTKHFVHLVSTLNIMSRLKYFIRVLIHFLPWILCRVGYAYKASRTSNSNLPTGLTWSKQNHIFFTRNSSSQVDPLCLYYLQHKHKIASTKLSKRSMCCLFCS